MDDIILFHGSRGGFDEDIKPISRKTCDFGKGFYMGTDIMQAKEIVSNDFEPYLYTLKLKLSEIPENKILDLRKNNNKWIDIILANRRKVPDFNKLEYSKKLIALCNNYDIIIGPIADDSMTKVMNYFRQNLITDKVLCECVKTVNLGTQYVAKNDFACSKIEILNCKEVTEDMAIEAKEYENIKRINSKSIIKDLVRNHRTEGLYLDQIIENKNNEEMFLDKEDVDYDR